MRCWESPGDLPLVIEIFLSLVEDHPVFPKNVCKNLLVSVFMSLIQIT